MARRSKFGRFQVANEASDPFKHTDVAYNLDNLDIMIGSDHARYGVGDDFNNPSTSAPTGTEYWLAPQDSTVIANFGVRSLYNIVRGLDYNSVPLGAVFAWFRPSSAVPLPSGCVPCDGVAYTGTDKHSYQAWGITTVTVPDLRNKMILGANAAITDGTAATLPSVDSASGAPGIRGSGGSNVPHNLTHLHGVGTYIGSDHTHSIAAHYHGMQHDHIQGTTTSGPSNGVLGAGLHLVTAPGGGAHGFYADGGYDPGSGFYAPNHTHTISAMGYVNGYGGGDSALAVAGNTATNTAINGGGAPAITGTATATAIGGSSGSALLTAIEHTPQYVGLLYVIKIRKAGPLHNTVFPPGT